MQGWLEVLDGGIGNSIQDDYYDFEEDILEDISYDELRQALIDEGYIK